MNLQRVWAILAKEFIQIVRDRRSMALALAMPLMQLLLFGYAVSTNVDRVSTVLLNRDPGPYSRELLEKFVQSKYFTVSHTARDYREVEALIAGGRAKVAMIIPPDYSQRVAEGLPAQVQVIIDGSDPLIAQTALASAGQIGQAVATEMLVSQLQRSGSGVNLEPLVDVRPRVWYNPDMESIKFNIPGLVGAILQNITLILTSFAIVRERERGTLEQLMVTPIRPVELMVGKIVPYIVIGFVDLGLILGLGVYWFKVEIAGSLWLLVGLSGLFLMGALGIGLLISTVSRTQLQAMQLSVFLIMPNFLISGFLFPREAMPQWIYAISNVVPLTYYLQVLRGIVLKGAALELMVLQSTVLAVFGISFLVLSALRFRKQLE